MITWAYIAGFFDGEGSVVWLSAGRNCHVQIVQAGDIGLTVLRRLQEFLMAQGIRSALRSSARPLGLGKKPLHALRVTYRAGCYLFLSKTLPYLQVKKVLAQDSLRFFLLYPVGQIGRLRRQEGVRLREQRRKLGLLPRQLARQNIDQHAI